MISGYISDGTRQARTFGFPTANLTTFTKNEPGIFFAKARVENNKQEDCVVYISSRNLNLVECHILGLGGAWAELYGKKMDIELVAKIRDDNADFVYYDDIVFQISRDVLVAKAMSSVCGGSSPKRLAVAFSGGKESCIIVDLLSRVGLLKNCDLIHFRKTGAADLDPVQTEFMDEFVQNYGTSFTVREYSDEGGSMETCVKEHIDGKYDVCFVGDRLSDRKNYAKKWMELTETVHPLNGWTYADVWDYIENFGVAVSPLYSLGYSSVGYNVEKNVLLCGKDGASFRHASKLKSFGSERNL